MTAVESWGRRARAEHEVRPLFDRDAARVAVTGTACGLPYGMGRSYGDVCLNPDGVLWQTPGLDRFIAFDDATGVLACEAGVLLRDVQRAFVPRGWALAVTPGTQLATIGGAIANDVHGQNHHRAGCFGDHVRRLRLARTDGSTIDCGPERERAWFEATVGGLGLTGLIVEAELQLMRVPGPWLDTETVPFDDLDGFFTLADASEHDWDYTVSWVDCLAAKPRGLFMRANPVATTDAAGPAHRARTVPFVPPVSLVNALTLKPFNALYYANGRRRAGRARAHYESFFYPLDDLLAWNRIYGPRGFYQYQSVVPRDAGRDATDAMLKAIAQSGEGSFLAVLKTFGDRQPVGLLSFAMPGVTLALDFPNRGDATARLFDRLDAIVRETRGRIYPAKDARMPRDLFEAGYPRAGDFAAYRDPGIGSALSRRLMGS